MKFEILVSGRLESNPQKLIDNGEGEKTPDLMNTDNDRVEIIAEKTGTAELQKIERGGVGEKRMLSAGLRRTILPLNLRRRRRSEDADAAMGNQEDAAKKYASQQYGKLSTSHLYGL